MYALTDEQMDKLAHTIATVNRMLGDTGSTPHHADDTQRTQDVYIVLAPTNGIPAATVSNNVVTPGTASCEVYKLLPADMRGTVTLVDAGFTINVGNVQPAAVPGKTYAVAKRDKFGSVVVEQSSAGATWIRVTSASADNNGFYTGVLVTYQQGLWFVTSPTPNVAIRAANNELLAANFVVVGWPCTDPSETNPTYITESGGMTGTIIRMVNMVCINGNPTAVVQADTIVNGKILQSA